MLERPQAYGQYPQQMPVYPANYTPAPPMQMRPAMPMQQQMPFWKEPEPRPSFQPRPPQPEAARFEARPQQPLEFPREAPTPLPIPKDAPMPLAIPNDAPATLAIPKDAPTPLPRPREEPRILETEDHHPMSPSLKSAPPVASIDPQPGMGLYTDEAPPPPWAPPHEHNPPHIGPRGYHFYAGADGIMWWTQRGHVPALVTTGPASAPGSTILIGGPKDLDEQERYGARANMGLWLNEYQNLAIEVGGFWLAPRSPHLNIDSPNPPLIARPFFDVNTQQPSFDFVAMPGSFSGGVEVRKNDQLWGAEANLRHELCRTSCFHLDMLAGYRRINYEEDIIINDTRSIQSPLIIFGRSEARTFDSFATRNIFNGAQIGFEGELHHGRFFVDVRAKLAVGWMEEQAEIGGSTVVIPAGGAQRFINHGFLAQPSNIGDYTRNEIALVPELGFNVGYKLTPNIRALAGYSCLYINRMIRPGDQIDTSLNLLQDQPGPLVGERRPRFLNKETDFWAQGVNFGLEIRY